MIEKTNKYTKMQKKYYDKEASLWTTENRNPVVGSFDSHNEWSDYEYLFEGIKNMSEKTILDFACGPGRNIVKYHKRLKQIDGVDISEINIEKAKQYLLNNDINDSNLYVSNGIDLDIIQSNSYDIVMSTIALQHICVYEIRYSIFKDIYRILKTNGIFTAQMGFGQPNRAVKNTVDYYENNYSATSTNGSCDVAVTSTKQLENDLSSIGFRDFNYRIGPVGPGDQHLNWIYFRSIK